MLQNKHTHEWKTSPFQRMCWWLWHPSIQRCHHQVLTGTVHVAVTECGFLQIVKGEQHKAPKQTKFDAENTELKIYIIDSIGSCLADLFMETKKHITSYVREKYSGDICIAVEDLNLPTITQPTLPANNPVA